MQYVWLVNAVVVVVLMNLHSFYCESGAGIG